MSLFDSVYKDFDRFFVGFDTLSDRIRTSATELAKTTGYPPYNIKKVDENKYVIEMAVAGFSKQDIEIEFVDGRLVVKGNVSSHAEDSTFIWKGISERAFTRQFQLADNVEIKNADLFNGMLKIWLEAIIPEHKKPKKIDITDGEAKNEKTFLTEDQDDVI